LSRGEADLRIKDESQENFHSSDFGAKVMRIRPWVFLQVSAIITTAVLTIAGAVVAQVSDPTAKEGAAKTPVPKAKISDKPAKGGLRASGGAPPKKLRRNVADPFANAAGQAVQGNNVAGNPTWPFHYKLKITSFDSTPLAAV
jgi:hypothetical protein